MGKERNLCPQGSMEIQNLKTRLLKALGQKPLNTVRNYELISLITIYGL